MKTAGLEHVCREVDGVCNWYYLESEQRYYKLKPNSDVAAKISGKFLPDPFRLEIERAQKRDLLPESKRDNYRVKCSPATHLLWEHWRRVQDGKSHSEL